MSTPLFHANYSGLAGLYFQLQDVPCFVPASQETVYLLPDITALAVIAQVPDDLARVLQATVIEPLLEPQKRHFHLRDGSRSPGRIVPCDAL